MKLRDKLDGLLTLTEEGIRVLEESSPEWQALADSKLLVLYGAGNLGRKILRGLRHHGRDVAGICDANPAVHGSIVDGIPVQSPEEAIKCFGIDAIFVVSVWNIGEASEYETISAYLTNLGCRYVAPSVPLLRMYPGTFLPYWRIDESKHVLEAKDKILQAFDIWSDDTSRQLFVDEVQFNLLPHGRKLRSTASLENQYFPDKIIKLTDNETFVDCGAFDGDTTREFLIRTANKFDAIYCFEPDAVNAAKLTAWKSGIAPAIRNKVSVFQKAVGDTNDTLTMEVTGTVGSTISTIGESRIDCVRLDDVLDRKPTYLKFDIESFEPYAIAGASETISSAQPKVAVCVYHEQRHLWDLPLQLHAILPDHAFYLEHHGSGTAEVVCYAVPRTNSH